MNDAGNRQAKREAFLMEEARLIILKELAQDVSGSATSSWLEAVIRDEFMIPRDRAWVHRQLDYLAEMGAVAVKDAGTVKVATLLHAGRRHVNREIAIEGVKRPSDPVA
ncbi:VpaChn25_0724 family phage protein [Ancylobacter defluvii]|uniref:Uncharacterized protein n=1 Tax=Ancylobacter defluvii TaxID=1282440 RepID=A0A9W6JYQ7_9HYPH|nr:hypothetical protein [Ancylobacter defluvii]MBS7586421.1 hypothetical protein [Ancylobacter defluvii]GLK85702.1 hypothetical protein GCM10017653_37720 [Ancylobacter defluvii]